MADTDKTTVKALQEFSYRGKPVKIGDIIKVEADEAVDYAQHGWTEDVPVTATVDTSGGAGGATAGPGGPTTT